MSFVVSRPGTFSLLVDSGRPQGLHVGLPRSGPADHTSFSLGNALVGNTSPEKMTALEITLQGPVLECTDSHQVVVFGAGFEVVHQRRDTKWPILPGHSFGVIARDTIHLNGIPDGQGLRAYFCVSGGFQSPEILGSRSALKPIERDEVLVALPSPQKSSRWIDLLPWSERSERLRILPGTHLKDALREQLLRTTFTVRPESNRMGLRLASDANWKLNLPELVSAPVVPGTLQLPPQGQPILLGIDAQTIGGYPRLGHVITPDLDMVGQLRPGETLRFKMVSIEEAEALIHSYQSWLKHWHTRLQLNQ
jgi:5-oxoprolinase (ATP-hydrolysing) subunit C